MGMKTIGRFTYDSSTPEAIAAGGNILVPQQTVSTRCLSCDGGVITINRCGVYEISANFTFAATAAGAIETIMYRNGNAVSGAYASSTAAAIGDYLPQTINAVITVPQNAPIAQIVFRATNATSVRAANIIVTKVA